MGKAETFKLPSGDEIYKIQQYHVEAPDVSTSPMVFKIRPWVTAKDATKGSCWASMPDEAKVKIEGGFLLITNGAGHVAGLKLPRSIDTEQEPIVQTVDTWVNGKGIEQSAICLHV